MCVLLLCCCCLVTQLCLTLLRPHGLQPTRILCSWDFPGKNTRMNRHFLFQGIFPTHGSHPCLLHQQADSSPREVPLICRKTNSRLPVIVHHGEFHNYFTIYHKAINNRNKCNVLESFQNHHPQPNPRSMEKLFAMKPVPGAKKVGDRCFKSSLDCL